MKKYTANYAYTNPNFVIQNLVEQETVLQDKALLYVLKNIFQRGFPTILSQYLQEKLGKIHEDESFKDSFCFISNKSPQWINTIRGDEGNNYYPAKDFLERIVPLEFGEFSFIAALLLPEVGINEIVGENNSQFVNQQVDFYLPQAKLVIEIDGQQHSQNQVIEEGDNSRDDFLKSKGYKVIRISTTELHNGSYVEKLTEIVTFLRTDCVKNKLQAYQDSFNLISNGSLSEDIIKKKLVPTAIMRFQILLLELILNGYLSFEKTWFFNIILRENEQLGDFAMLAIEDFFNWYGQLFKLKHKKEFAKPGIHISKSYTLNDFNPAAHIINIDFSLFERWIDGSDLQPDLIMLRTDYFGAEKNYFQVSCADPLDYNITEEDKPVLEFFLLNIFEKSSFRPGQFPIISNVLNRKDTVGLLPTGGGKSICYQLPCLLQPSINFVVCPIKSLMYDQQLNMKSAFVTNTNSITGDLPPDEKEKVQRDFAKGKYLFIWISPERFQIDKFRNYISSVVTNRSIAYAVIDEVHCMSEWGHDFRTSYLNLTKTIQRYCPNASFIGLTATASVHVLKDIKVEFSRNNRGLGEENIKSLLDYSRKELHFEVIRDDNNKLQKLLHIIEENEILTDCERASLVFAPHVNGRFGCYSVAKKICTVAGNMAQWYSGEVPKLTEYNDRGNRTGRKIPVMDEENFKVHKSKVQNSFKKNLYPVLVATKAFGMGIDKGNIHYTIHYGIPSSVEALYQEAGRAGRWEDKEKKAFCYVLYSPETMNEEKVNRLFELDATFEEIRSITEEVGRSGRDIFRQIFLFLQGKRDVKDDFTAIKLLIDKYYKPDSKQKIWFHDVTNELRKSGIAGSRDQLREIAQKAIYRLRILGIVQDWTTNFTNHFEVQFNVIDEQVIYEALLGYISKYQADIDLAEELDGIDKESLLDKAIWYLLKWTFENISYNRKQSLKTLADWCDEFEEIGNEAFKKRIDNYFRFTDTTFVFQHIAENPAEYQMWFEVFYIGKDLTTGQDGIYIPAIKDDAIRHQEFERLRDSLSRFLESYRSSVGLNLVSGLIRLALADFADPDGRQRFEIALQRIKNTFEEDRQEAILKSIIEYGDYLSTDAQEVLCMTITKLYPSWLESLADHYGLFYLLDSSISMKVKRLRTINNKLYEEFEQIREI